MGGVINANVDAGDVYVILLDKTFLTRVSILRIHGSETTAMPTASTDWSDYAANGFIGINPTRTALVSGGKAYFLGLNGVTTVPLDGSPSAILYPPLPDGRSGHAIDQFESFTADEGNVYVCESDFTTGSLHLGRFGPDGTWQLLFTGTRLDGYEDCHGTTMAADTDAVYWSTNQAIREYNKNDGTVRTVVDLEEGQPPFVLAIAGSMITWFDTFDSSFHAAPKTGFTSSQPAALGATTLFHIDDVAPAPYSMFGTSDAIYWLTPFELHRVAFADGKDERRAQRSMGMGFYMGLATDGQTIYFTDSHNVPGDGGLGEVDLRSVPQ